MDLRKIISEILNEKLNKKTCSCGCGGCNKAPLKLQLSLNENKVKKTTISEGLNWHLTHQKPLTEHLYRAGSQKYFDLWKEARSLYSRGLLEVNNPNDLELIKETNLGEFGILENGEKVPLDFPMLEENKNTHNITLTFDDERLLKRFKTIPTFAKMLAPNQMRNLKVGENKLVVNNVALNGLERMSSMGLYKFSKDLTESKNENRKYIVMWRENSGERWVLVNKDKLLTKLEANKIYKEQKNNFKFKPVSVEIFDYMDFYNKYWMGGAFPNVYSPEKFFLLQNQYPKDLTESKKENKPLNKPMRDSSGGKAYKVYVRDPKTKNIKTVRFGSGGLKAKVSDPEARKRYAARHRCSEKKDRTKASYWSCRLPRYWKQLGGNKNYSGYW